MVGWYHRLNGHEFGYTPGVRDGQGSLVCCSPWGHKESDMTEWLNWISEFLWVISLFILDMKIQDIERQRISPRSHSWWEVMLIYNPLCLNPAWHQVILFQGKPRIKITTTSEEIILKFGFSTGSVVKNPPAMQETWVWSLVWKIPWRKRREPTPIFLLEKSHGQRNLVVYSPWGLKRVRHDWVTKQQF